MGCYFGLELLALDMFWSGMGLTAVRVGVLANAVGFIAATAVSLMLVRFGSSRIVREGLWLSGCLAAVVVFVAIVMSVGGGEKRLPWPVEWAAMASALIGVVTLIRTLGWLIRGGAHKFHYWPETAVIVGVCLLAYGGSGVINDRDEDMDRYLATLGAGLTATAVLFRRRASST